jgi:tetratricopeptide (TPR) repeat protein
VHVPKLFVSTLALAAATPAFGQSEPPQAPPPAWADPQPLPPPDPKQADKPVQQLLFDVEMRFGPGQPEQYREAATLIQNPQGLAAMGTIAIPWSPDVAELIVNKLQIVRGGKTIDILANQHFTVLRRENNLERAMLDGSLTAVIQPEGLSVGDIVLLGITVRQKPGALPFAPEGLMLLGADFPIRHVRFREVLPDALKLRWNASAPLGHPRVKKGGGTTELVFDLNDATLEKPPADAPARYRIPGWLQVTGYGGWEDISRLFAPAYAKAATLAEGSPVAAEIAKIAAASPDPRRRAAAALRLVQDQVRYVAVAIGEAGYIPVGADQTWARKYGDCKGKTALLMALLKGLGIEAEPALVSTGWADSLPSRLPQIQPFDHVIVRAKIEGKSYWLDGTRSGDRSLDDLAALPFASALPLTAAGAPLESADASQPARPLSETNRVYDAAKGFLAPVPVTEEQTYRGDQAAGMRAILATLGADPFKKKMAEAMTAEFGENPKVEVVPDDGNGALIVRYSGTHRMSWSGSGHSKALRFQFENDTISWGEEFKRDEGAYKDAPIALGFPVFMSATETVILPLQGKGFTLDAPPLDKIVAGTRIARTVAIENGRAVARSTFVRLKREIDAAEGRASAAALKEVNADKAFVVAPEGYAPTTQEKAASLAVVPRTADEHISHGFELMQASRYDEALADFDKAIAQAPSSVMAYADKAITLLHLGRAEEAEPLLRQAAKLDSDSFAVHQGLGMLAMHREKPAEAIAEYSRAIELDADNSYSIVSRAVAYAEAGKLHEAVADTERALKAEPDDRWALAQKARFHAALGEGDAALAAGARLVALEPGEPGYLAMQAALLKRFGRQADAEALWDKALAAVDAHMKQGGEQKAIAEAQRLELLRMRGDYRTLIATATERLKRLPGNVLQLEARCRARADGAIELQAALQDCNGAIAYDNRYANAYEARGRVNLRLENWGAAIADYTKALSFGPELNNARYGRGLAELAKGDKEAGEHDLAAARARDFDVDWSFKAIGFAPKPKA